ncbi:uncharacterized protein [Dermacentor andersoni]|uniref:uncharacterized protein isoform X2 n=1 Tax=Dermacentor andersoni TaxID=34620 RepID=UPI003B3AF44D
MGKKLRRGQLSPESNYWYTCLGVKCRFESQVEQECPYLGAGRRLGLPQMPRLRTLSLPTDGTLAGGVRKSLENGPSLQGTAAAHPGYACDQTVEGSPTREVQVKSERLPPQSERERGGMYEWPTSE